MYIYLNNIGINFDSMAIKTYILKTLFISICTYVTFLKITNANQISTKKKILFYICIFLISIIITILKYISNSFMTIICLGFLMSVLCSIATHNNIGYSILISIISLSFNYILFVVGVMITFIINIVIPIKNDFFNLVIMIIIHTIILYKILKINRLRYGVSFLKSTAKDEYFDMLVLNISVTILFSISIFANIDISISKSLFLGFVIFAAIMFITIQKSLQLYYKQKLLVKELDETKQELESKNREIKELEKENLNFSKTSHSLAHKQRALEYKINQLIQKNEIADEIEIKNRIEKISNQLYKQKSITELGKTGISEIDDMLKYMQSECVKNKIEFELQIRGNIHHMVNNKIVKEDLEILIADHIKNAIIAINSSENPNRSILVKIGQIDKIYSLYIYDSGIEFEKETLLKLGKEPSTTHADSGGTGIGFMNTFDTLRKYKASLTINEFCKPSKDNYTKAIIIKFDNKQEVKINSYREIKI